MQENEKESMVTLCSSWGSIWALAPVCAFTSNFANDPGDLACHGRATLRKTEMRMERSKQARTIPRARWMIRDGVLLAVHTLVLLLHASSSQTVCLGSVHQTWVEVVLIRISMYSISFPMLTSSMQTSVVCIRIGLDVVMNYQGTYTANVWVFYHTVCQDSCWLSSCSLVGRGLSSSCQALLPCKFCDSQPDVGTILNIITRFRIIDNHLSYIG